MKRLSYFFLASLMLLGACNGKEPDTDPGEVVPEKVKLTVVRPSGAWAEGDQLLINGQLSVVSAESAGKNSTVFTFNKSDLKKPYLVGYPAAAFSDFADGIATVTVPGEFLMASGESVYVSLANPLSTLELTVTGEDVASLTLTSPSKAITGKFTTDFKALTASTDARTSISVSLEEGFVSGGVVTLVIPAGDYTSDGFEVILADSEGATQQKTLTPSAAFEPGAIYRFQVSYDTDTPPVPQVELEAEFITATSSSLVFGWTNIESETEDAAFPYTIAVYKDADCTDLALSYEIPAGAGCWGENPLRFVFGGLEPSTTYYFVATNTQTGGFSEPVEGTTEPFTVVDPSTVTTAAEGDVILAEDFSEIAWGADETAVACGFIPSPKRLEPLSGNKTTDDGNFVEYKSTGGRLYGDTPITSDKRLFNWGFFGNSSVYSFNGYLRVGVTTSGARTHIVSPALSGIPEGLTATIDVTVTSCKAEENANDVAVFVNDFSSLTRVLDPDKSDDGKFNGNGGKFTGASLTDGYPLEALAREWSTKTVRISKVRNGDCLLFGSYSNVDTKNRFWINDVKVQIVSIDKSADVDASLGKATSCSLTFTWTEGVSAAEDVAKPWTIALYKDADCTDLVVSHVFEAGHSCWSDKQPRFIFGGLDPSTDYWFKAVDTTPGAEKESDVIKATTLPFTRVDANTVSNASVGDILLAEDFSETFGPDEWDEAAGFKPSPKTLNPPSGEDPDGSYDVYGSTGTHFWGNKVEMTPGRRLAGGWGFYGNCAVYSRAGYFRVATTKGRTHIVTPKLSGIPDGVVATVKVTVTALLHEKASDVDVAVFAESGLVLNSTTDISSASYCKYTGASLSEGYALGLANTTQKKWYTKSVLVEGVSNQHHLIIGSLNNVSSKNRFNIADITVELVAIEDPNRTTKVSILGDSISTFKSWCDETKGGAYYPKSDCDVESVDKTWWYNLIYSKMKTGVFEKNISAGNTTVVQNSTGDSGAYWYGWDFGTRLQKFGLGNPDVVIIFGGTNDYGHTLYNDTSEELIAGVAMGAESFPDTALPTLQALFDAADAATTVDAADALDGSTFCSAYIRLIQMLRTRYPSAKIVCVIGDYLYYGLGDAVRLIAKHYSDDYVRAVDILGEYGYKSNSKIPKYNYAHPTASGMAVISSYIYSEVGSWIDAQ